MKNCITFKKIFFAVCCLVFCSILALYPQSLRAEDIVLQKSFHSIGGDYTNLLEPHDEGFLGRAPQGTVYDPWDNRIYTLGQMKSGSSEPIQYMRIWASVWSDKEHNRKFLKVSKGKFNSFGHQGIALYRPTKESPLLFFSGGHPVVDRGVKDLTNMHNLNLIHWDINKNTLSVVRTWQLFNPEEYYPSHLNVCITPDNQYLVVRSRRKADKVYEIRIYNVRKLLAQKNSAESPIDASSALENFFLSPWGKKNVMGQNMATDGKRIFFLTSGVKTDYHEICVTDFQGNILAPIRKSYEGREIKTPFGLERNEGESLFFAPVNGKNELILSVYVKIYEDIAQTKTKPHIYYYVVNPIR